MGEVNADLHAQAQVGEAQRANRLYDLRLTREDPTVSSQKL